MKIKKYVIGTIVIAAILIAGVSCTQKTSVPPLTAPSQSSDQAEAGSSNVVLPPSTLPVGKDGLIKAVIPKNLFGGENMTAEEFAKGYQDNPNPQFYTGAVVNSDETVTLSFTPAQLKKYREGIYNNLQFQNDSNTESIKDVQYEDDMLTKITISVDLKLYNQNGLERQMCHSLMAGEAGTYQVLSGTPPDEWNTIITIKDASTGKIIDKTNYPYADMYITK